MALIYRRLALIAGARAEIQPLARAWGVLIWGHIGRYNLRALECYPQLKEARARRREVNGDGVALVESVENILYPLSAYTAMYDTEVHKPPPLPPTEKDLQPFSRVEDVYDLPRLRKRG
jgi:hypothetical protein